MNLEPIVKWSGSKRSQAGAIVARMPREIATYYEPFCGGCSVLYRLLNTPSIKVERFVASDVNKDLISLWNMIRDKPEELCSGYEELWEVFNRHGLCEEDYERRKEVFYTVRNRYNKEHSPIDFLFVMRTTTNGMPRYNDRGEFNNSCHFSRPGIHPRRLKEICLEWSRLLNEKNVEFRNNSYEALCPTEADILYLDPPYASVHKRQMYFGGIDIEAFVKWLSSQKCKWILSFDGIRGDTDCTYALPKSLYVSHEYLNAGNSSFERYLGKGRTEEVYESLYLNYIPALQVRRKFVQPTLF